jgi:lysine-specific demethylase 8
MIGEIQRIYRPTKDELYEKTEGLTIPILIQESMSHWKAICSWNEESLKLRFGDEMIEASWSNDLTFRGDPENGFKKFEECKFSELLDVLAGRVTTTRKYYVQAFPFTGSFASLLGDIQIPEYLNKYDLRWTNLWIGAAGNISALHFDYVNNLLCQVHGEKRIVLYSPEQSEYLYPFSKDSCIPFVAQVDIDHPRYSEFPRFIKARQTEATLGPGDILFIPNGWWHQVYSRSFSISVTFWYKTPG